MLFSSAQIQNLRLGAVAQAAHVKEAAANSWRVRNNLNIGREHKAGGNRRYDLADAAKLILMRFLTERFKMSGPAAALAVNHAHGKFHLLCMFKYSLLDHPEVRVPEVETEMVLDRTDGSMPPEIYVKLHDEPRTADTRFALLTIRLNEIVEYALDELCSVVGGDPNELRRRLPQ